MSKLYLIRHGKTDWNLKGLAQGRVDIPLNEDGKNLIMFRDSYGSSIAPLLLEGYSKIILIDSRYIHSNFIQNVISFENLENIDVLFIHSTTILNEASILK
jgi:hypothetical protein